MVCEKDKLQYSKYVPTNLVNLITWELSSGEVILKRAIMDNLELDDPSLVAAVKRLNIMISDKDAILLMFSMINAVISSLTILNQLRVIGKTTRV